ncbi:MAG: histidine phosphatase family protein [Pseudohongiellaceae bacterium]|nr:histidine phosphatase family protein [Pseudohongiellaceae bacterium]
MSELIFVRHGQASFGAESYDKLSPLGVEQVRQLARYWEANGERFDHLYSGELLRQRETANELLPLLKQEQTSVGVLPGLNEYDGSPLIDIYLRDHHPKDDPVSLPIQDRKKFQLVFEETTSRWIRGELEPAQHDTAFEAWIDFQRRVHGVIDDLMRKHTGGSRVLVSTSGGVIALALQRVLDLPDEQAIAANWMVNNSSVTKLRYGGGRISLTLFNGLSHLEAPELRDMITYR